MLMSVDYLLALPSHAKPADSFKPVMIQPSADCFGLWLSLQPVAKVWKICCLNAFFGVSSRVPQCVCVSEHEQEGPNTKQLSEECWLSSSPGGQPVNSSPQTTLLSASLWQAELVNADV